MVGERTAEGAFEVGREGGDRRVERDRAPEEGEDVLGRGPGRGQEYVLQVKRGSEPMLTAMLSLSVCVAYIWGVDCHQD